MQSDKPYKKAVITAKSTGYERMNESRLTFMKDFS